MASLGGATTPNQDASSGAPGAAPTTDARPSKPASDPAMPAFDVVRVQPGGDAVIAGRGAPGSEVALVDGDAVLGKVVVDASGQFAMLPPALAAGSHYLTLRATRTGEAAVTSTQGVAVTVAANGTAKPLVALLTPDKPAEILSDGAPVQKAASGDAGSVSVAIQAVEAQQGGRFTASGRARAGSQCRIYLNGAYLADVTADKDGRWSVAVEKGMQPGRYVVRADQLESANGKVVNRAEVRFDYPAAMVAGGSKRLLVHNSGSGTAPAVVAMAADPSANALAGQEPASATDANPDALTQTGAAAVIPDLHTAKVIRGDSLWRISRKMLGHGIKYTEIYASNATQIRNPKLIYPGQVFVVPNQPTQ